MKNESPGGAGAAGNAGRAGTKFCRIPQWLYGSGVSLQAIATYGWLHGKYGFLPVINPSYATLAEELNCSRGSVITYLKELVRVGAVRITVGGPKRRTINTYEIAFDAPFPLMSGQPADHSGESSDGGAVSPLTSSGQSADQKPGQSGQRAVPDKEELPKTKEDSLSSPASPVAAAPSASPEERETGTPRLTAAQQAVRSSSAVSLEEEAEFIAWLTTKFDVQSPKWWRTAARDLPDHAAVWRAQRSSITPLPQTSLPDWCGHCGSGNPAAATNPKFRTHNGSTKGTPCPACHPDALKDAAA